MTPSSTAAVVPPAPWVGGKSKLARRIIARIAAEPHDAYVEPFVGMGGVFLRRPERARVEVINDLSTDVAVLFRCLQRHYVPLMDMLRWQVTSRTEFERLRAATADSLTDLERAVRFLYLQRLAWGGKATGRNFGVDPNTPARFNVSRLEPILEALHERLAGVVIERLPYADLIARYDRPTTLFYLDPPYWGCEEDYGAGMFSRDDFARLAGVLAGIKGRFLLSLNDRPEVRRLFARFVVEGVVTRYTINPAKSGSAVGELIISGGPGGRRR